MKKTYKMPALSAQNLELQGMIALSKSENPANPALPSLAKERQQLEDDEEFEMINILREQEEGAAKTLW
ncbi:MAG: hypothetical protein ACI3YI_06385 [Bacteroidaceae bacterium]